MKVVNGMWLLMTQGGGMLLRAGPGEEERFVFRHNAGFAAQWQNQPSPRQIKSRDISLES